jgi:hypothetical protein
MRRRRMNSLGICKREKEAVMELMRKSWNRLRKRLKRWRLK